MENQMELNFRKHLSELLNSNKLVIALEIILVLAPTQVSLILGFRPESDFISIAGNLVLLGGPLIYLGMILTILVFWIISNVRGVGWQIFGVSLPKRWIRTLFSGIGMAIVMIIVIVVSQELASLAFPDAVPPDMSRFGALQGSLPNLILNVVVMWITAGFIEELIWRGYLMNRLTNIFGSTKGAWLAALFCSAALFGIAHYYQGPSGMLITGVTGLLLGGAFLISRGNIWPLVIAHGLINTVSFVDMYLNGI